MDLSRRHFAALCAGLGVAPLSTLASASGALAFLSAYRDPAGAFGVAALDEAGTILFTEALPARGHDTVVSPDDRWAVTFARRPGRFALVIDLTRQLPAAAFEAAPGRHFYGHGFFSPDGRLLYATENDYEGERGLLGIYDASEGYARIGAFATHGIGPHEALLLRDGRTIAVANGGILTHPDFPRQKLNLASMAPSISYLDRATGDLLEQVSLPASMHQLSIRHMIQAGDGSIWFGGQYEGAPTDAVALVGRHKRGQEIALVSLPEAERAALRQYVGSIKSSVDGEQIAFTSPRGGLAIILGAQSQAVLDVRLLADVCGVAPERAGFAFSTGQGDILASRHALTDVSWDNHLRSFG
ncbi:MAG: DUF1513 domain-containing protein [Hyphomicrobiales bacterium]